MVQRREPPDALDHFPTPCPFRKFHPVWAEWLARQITEAFPWTSGPAYLVRDNDRAYGHIFTSRVSVRDRPISFRSPWQNPYVERLLGTVRRECLDRVLIFGEAHLRPILSWYAAYYNEVRLALGKGAPAGRGNPTVRRHCRYPNFVRAAPILCPDIIFGKDTLPWCTRLRTYSSPKAQHLSYRAR